MYEFLKGNGKKKWELLSISNGIPPVLKITVFGGKKCTMIHAYVIMGLYILSCPTNINVGNRC